MYVNVSGIVGILWSGLWFFMVTNSPSEHPKISRKELNYIEGSLKGESDIEVRIYFSSLRNLWKTNKYKNVRKELVINHILVMYIYPYE